MNLDADVSQRTEQVKLTIEPIDLDLLKQQHQYFNYTIRLLFFLQCEYRKRMGVEPVVDAKAPKSIPAPPKTNRIKA